MDHFTNLFAQNIRICRKLASMTQTDLSALTGITQNQIYRYESGKQMPSCLALSKIAKALSVDPGQFFY